MYDTNMKINMTKVTDNLLLGKTKKNEPKELQNT